MKKGDKIRGKSVRTAHILQVERVPQAKNGWVFNLSLITKLLNPYVFVYGLFLEAVVTCFGISIGIGSLFNVYAYMRSNIPSVV